MNSLKSEEESMPAHVGQKDRSRLESVVRASDGGRPCWRVTVLVYDPAVVERLTRKVGPGWQLEFDF